ncbi:hypothetical protein BVE84_03750 [Streptococcus azizii]|uniref:Uncharacterized protein n=1 Tax=Streptococcus azizii TaxID=1579424 RepID=A0AB36JNB1_9STRE|nr:hypothetical protein BVE86_03180 [Streptococcus azizii]ONK28989.1 hypothetical protein BVE85_03910 [Streptococcus azizii]ONK30185.1 hypothetical protein BVE84_03750 [Streptococcus azizii]
MSEKLQWRFSAHFLKVAESLLRQTPIPRLQRYTIPLKLGVFILAFRFFGSDFYGHFLIFG